mmetsp:Transcript_29626/g.27081  ORF Transcript_29626/g.27081 Transcript_29626/m.27081 type:complete len:167 (+) Transcript_29626:297-797(+)
MISCIPYYHYKNQDTSKIVFELAPYGCLLKAVGKAKRLPESICRTFLSQLLSGVEYLHQNKIAHLDLKLENVLVGKNYKLKICDFDASYQATDGFIMSRGSKFYRAPEVRDRSCVDPYKADIYSLGVLLFVMCMGCYPFAEDAALDEELLESLKTSLDSQYWVTDC